MIFEPGYELGDYRITGVLNEGGWAVVYAAVQQDLKREVALKVLKPELIERPESSHRFSREAKVITRVKHPHIVEVYDFVENWEQWPVLIYIVMERLQGEDIASRLENSGPLSMQEVILVGMQVASALEALHAEKILHRDIKPDNIFMVEREEGKVEVRLLDFGLAKGLGALHGTNLTRAGATIGTMEYISPEQAMGRQADQRADVYGLGAALYTMLTSELPFGFAPEREDLDAFLTRIAERPVPPPSRYRPSIPTRLESVVMRCMEKKPEDRFGSMAELSDALRRCLDQMTEARDGAETPSWARLRPGEKVGNLVIMERLHRGDTSTVYSASHQRLGRAVALKFLNPELTGYDEQVQRFVRQATALSRVSHPNVVRVFELVEQEELEPPLYVMVMELLIGWTLHEHVRKHRLLDPEEVVALGVQVAEALVGIHAADILHRDVKPETVFLTNRPGKGQHATLIGFGLVKTFGGSQTDLTQDGMAVGTPEFMAPEQIMARDVDARTDVYGLGATLYEMLTGRPPFGLMKDFGEMVVKQTKEPPAPINQRRELKGRAAIPDGLDAVVMRCLEKSPSDRFQSAEELRAALEASLEVPKLQPPAPAPAPAPAIAAVPTATTAVRFRRQRPAWIIPLVVGLLLLLSAAGFYVVYRAMSRAPLPKDQGSGAKVIPAPTAAHDMAAPAPDNRKPRDLFVPDAATKTSPGRKKHRRPRRRPRRRKRSKKPRTGTINPFDR
jgi:serine/threonine protein kinase